MNNISTISNNNEKNNLDITLITAFFDINRNNWKVFNRNNDFYINSFKKYLELDYKMIIFIDDKILEKYYFQNTDRQTFIPINLEWLKNNTKSWEQLEKVRNIMLSIEYKNLVKKRIENENPENIYAEYNIINHSKIDFIYYAIVNNLINPNDFICWSDFGYFGSILSNNPEKFPNATLDIKKFNNKKLNFCLRNKINEFDKDPIYTLVVAPEIFTGSFFGGSQDKMIELYFLYHECLNELYDKNISDDDQHVYLRAYFKKPELFELFLSDNKWPEALVYFQIDFNNRLEFIENYIKNISNGIFVEIGVCNGDLSDFILDKNKNCKLYCVDPYISYNDYDDSCNNFVGDKLYEEVKNKLYNKYNDRFSIIREFSENAIKYVPNNLDFVYIDGNHKYSYVLNDINIWFKKLKPNGFIICDDAVDTDDYIRDNNGNVFIKWAENCEGKYGVIKACKDFCKLNNLGFYKMKNQIIIFNKIYGVFRNLHQTTASPEAPHLKQALLGSDETY